MCPEWLTATTTELKHNDTDVMTTTDTTVQIHKSTKSTNYVFTTESLSTEITSEIKSSLSHM